MKRLARLVPPFALLAAAFGGDLVLPRKFEAQEAPLGNRYPFGPGPENWKTVVRYQQAYGASELAPLKGGSITHVAFRLDSYPKENVQGGGKYFMLELRLSTRAGLVDQLLPDLDANPGLNETLVFRGLYTLPDLRGRQVPEPNPFDLVFELQEAFPYGGDDLLLDVQYASETVPVFYLDATDDDASDQVSRAVELTNQVAIDSLGLVTRFTVNGPQVGTSYCGPAVPNSSGLPGRIGASGSAVVAHEFLSLQADQLPPGELGYFLVSDTQGFVQPPGSQGNLCLGGQIGRYAKQALQADVDGRFALPIDLTALPLTPPHAVQPGETWNFQAWFRDKNPGATSNFTDGVSVLFQ